MNFYDAAIPNVGRANQDTFNRLIRRANETAKTFKSDFRGPEGDRANPISDVSTLKDAIRKTEQVLRALKQIDEAVEKRVFVMQTLEDLQAVEARLRGSD